MIERDVEHRQATARGCTCGARFKDVRDLRKHVTRTNREFKKTTRRPK